MRTAFIDTLCTLAERDDRIWLVCGDLGYSVLERFAERFPTRFLNVGVAEQNMTGVAAGLAMSGKTVFTYSIANFPTLRCLEQIRNDVCYHSANVKVVAVGGGFSYGAQGYTHHGVEDLAIMRCLPNLAVMAPGDPWETRVLTRLMADRKGPCYLRLGKTHEPQVHSNEPNLQWGEGLRVKEGSDIAILSTGCMLKNALDAAMHIEKQGLSVAVYSFPWVKPLDTALVEHLAPRFTCLVTVEEGQIAGGFGGAVAEILAALPGSRSRLLRIGVPDTILTKACAQEEARRRVGLDAESMGTRIQKFRSSGLPRVM